MKKTVVAIIAFMMFMSMSIAEDITYYGLSNGDTAVTNIDFTDLKNKPSDYWAKPAIYEMAALDIIKGFSDKTFSPSSQLTSEQAVVLILNATGKKDEVNALTSVTSKDTWSDKYIRYAISNGIITEKIVMKKADLKANSNIDALKKSGVFIRDNVITREETAGLVTRALGLTSKTGEMDFFDESSIDETYLSYVKAVTEAGIMKGTEGKMFSPKGLLRREEMAQVLKNAEEYILKEMNIFKGKALIDSISDAKIEATDENGDAITIDISGKEIPVYKNGNISGKSALVMSDDMEYYFDASKQVKFIGITSEGDPNAAENIQSQKSIQGIVSGNSPYFEEITIKDSAGESRVYNYGSWTEFYKDGKEASSLEVLQGDTIYIEFDEIGDVISIRAVSNYKITYGTVVGVEEDEYTIKFDAGDSKEYNLKNVHVYKNGQEIRYTDIAKGEYAKLYNYDTALAKLEIVRDERVVENIYKGKINEINLIQDKIILENPDIYEKGYWKKADVGFISIPLDKDIYITFYGETINKEELGENQTGKFAYVATRQDVKEIEKAKSIRIDIEKNESTYIYGVKSYDNGEIALEGTSSKVYTDDSTIMIENGRIVEDITLNEDDKVYITTSKSDGRNVANVIQSNSYEENSDIEIYAGTIYDIEGNEQVQLEVISKFANGDWYKFSGSKYTSLNITDRTRIISQTGPINIKDFSLEENASYDGMNVCLAAYGKDIIELSLTDLGEEPLIIKGTLSNVVDSTLTVTDLVYYDMEEEDWIDDNKKDVVIDASTIIIRNGEVIKLKDLEEEQKITVLKINDDTINTAGVVLIDNE